MTDEQIIEMVSQDRQTIIRHIPDEQYPDLSKLLKKGAPIRHTLLSILRWIQNRNIYSYDGYNFHMTAKQITKARGRKSGNDVSNRHCNFLCACGLLRKVPQKPNKPEELTKINRNFLANTDKRRPINTFGIVRYTDVKLGEIDEKCRLLKEKGVTPGNISHDQLVACGLEELANEIYYANDRTTADKKRHEFDRICGIIDTFIREKHCCTLAEVRGQYRAQTGAYAKIDVDRADKVFEQVRKENRQNLKKRYRFKPPTEEERETYGLKSCDYIYLPIQIEQHTAAELPVTDVK